jgi:hypothetical protein
MELFQQVSPKEDYFNFSISFEILFCVWKRK